MTWVPPVLAVDADGCLDKAMLDSTDMAATDS
jgi:hypothetical protein